MEMKNNPFYIRSPFLENIHAYNGKLHERYTTSIYNIVYDIFAENDYENPLGGYVEPNLILSKAREIVFNFDYGINNITIENKYLGKINLKDSFEKAFIDKYLTDEIAYESFTLWQSKLKGKLEEIVPMLNLTFNTFCEIELRDLKGGYKYVETVDNTHNDTDTRKGTVKVDSTQNSSNVGSSFPVNEVNAFANLQNVNYASNGNQNRSKGNDVKTNDLTDTNKGGYNTVRTIDKVDSNLLDNLAKLRRSYDDLITKPLKEFSYLFMCIM